MASCSSRRFSPMFTSTMHAVLASGRRHTRPSQPESCQGTRMETCWMASLRAPSQSAPVGRFCGAAPFAELAALGVEGGAFTLSVGFAPLAADGFTVADGAFADDDPFDVTFDDDPFAATASDDPFAGDATEDLFAGDTRSSNG